ncbi:MAG: hypothetical protein MZV64_03825, partial [Ignavibacteriales bacterium]|nr:hypothetical protein [Ignavibacteriales bacterium]
SYVLLRLNRRLQTESTAPIQANTPAAFDEKDIQIFQTLADQLAAAIENAQLLQKIEGNLSALTIASRLQTQQSWQASIDQQERPSYEYDGLQIRTVPRNLPNDLLKQLENGRPVIVKGNQRE